jgi:aspartokinase/homoserine dehydrogenase 1
MNDLVAGGDRILRIDGVLSGTLSYLFNSLTPGTKFSDIVRQARDRGFTEPDPREDLNGLDVGRKLLILAREAGFPLEFRDIHVTSLIPARFLALPTVKDFMRALPGLDEAYEREREAAAREGKVLRYVASLGDGRGEVSLQRVGPDHPCYPLAGSDILIAMTTTNAKEHPIVIKGPGAGADVTATGIFADIIRISHHQG